MNGRASKNIAQSRGKSIARLIVKGVKKVKDAYVKKHKENQERLDMYGTEAIFK